MLSGFNLHRSTKLVIKFITSVKLVWIPDADGSFSCSPDFVFIQLHRKATNAVSHYMSTELAIASLIAPARHRSYLPFLICVREKRSEEPRAHGCRLTAVCIAAGCVCAATSSSLVLCTRGAHPGHVRGHQPAPISVGSYRVRAEPQLFSRICEG